MVWCGALKGLLQLSSVVVKCCSKRTQKDFFLSKLKSDYIYVMRGFKRVEGGISKSAAATEFSGVKVLFKEN